MFSLRFFDRFSMLHAESPIAVFDGYAFEETFIRRLTWNVRGGPQEADIWLLLDRDAVPLIPLGGRLEVIDAMGSLIWWGWIATIDSYPYDAGYAQRLNLAEMENRITITYYAYDGQGKSTDTLRRSTHAEDRVSEALYGLKDGIHRLTSFFTPEQITGYRAQLLAGRAMPAPALLRGGGDSQPAQERSTSMNRRKASVRLIARGYWETLGWVYGFQRSGYEGLITATKSARQLFGDNYYFRRGVLQEIRIGGAQPYEVSSFWFRARRKTSDAVGLRIDLMGYDPPDATFPTTVLQSFTIPGESFPPAMDWIRAPLAAQTVLPRVRYALRLFLPYGSMLEGEIEVDEGVGYPDGQCYVIDQVNSISYSLRTPAASLVFLLSGQTDNLNQVKNGVMGTPAGQFLKGVQCLAGDGVTVQLFQDESLSVLESVENFLHIGNGAGDALLATITAQRVLQIRRQPPETDVRWRINQRGEVVHVSGMRPGLDHLPLGEWAAFADGSGGRRTCLLTEAVYDGESGELRVT